MAGVTGGASAGVSIRRLLHRKVLASNRHRTAMGQRLGLRANELAALNLLAEHETLTPSELASLLVLTSGGVTTLVQRLERLGHVHRRPHPHDGRSWVLSADAEALEEMSRLSAPLVTALEDVIAALPASEHQAIARFLTRVNGATEQAADHLLRDPGDAAAGESDDGARDAGGLAPGLWT
jgi:DNA-binding MarR family transcriptional regulator